MFDHRVCGMIVLAMLIAAPALVFADVEHSHQFVYAYSRAQEYQLVSVDTPGREGPDLATMRPRQAERLNGSDFPVRGFEQFARTAHPTTAIVTGQVGP